VGRKDGGKLPLTEISIWPGSEGLEGKKLDPGLGVAFGRKDRIYFLGN